MRIVISMVVATVLLTGCSMEPWYAPVMDGSGAERIPHSGIYHVRRGETVYSIAWRFGLDYRSLAERNHLRRPYHLYIGETLYLRSLAARTPSRQEPKSTFANLPPYRPVFTADFDMEPAGEVSYWHWPAQGPIIGSYSAFNKGINIAGSLGEPVYAAAAGTVVYSGHGLRGYGNLIIIKHNGLFLTAYAHNRRNQVVEGAKVQVGQKIAEMGNTASHRIMLHFEIRRGGQSVNPLDYLGHH